MCIDLLSEVLNVVQLLFVRLDVRASPLLVKDRLDLAGVDQIVDLVTSLAPVALTTTVLFDCVWRLAKVTGVREVLWGGLRFVDGPFVSSSHDDDNVCVLFFVSIA